MNAKGWMTFNALVARYSLEDKEALLQFLPEEEREAAGKQSDGGGQLDALIAQPEKRLRSVHYSWIAPMIQQYDKSLRPYFIASLPQSLKQKIEKLFDQPPVQLSLSEPVKLFFNGYLAAAIDPEDVLPIAFVPESDLSPLLELRPKKLVELIDILGIHDLAAEYHQIIDKKVIDSILRHLGPEQREYLRHALKKPQSKPEKRLPLQGMNGDGRGMDRLLHRSGLCRLGSAMIGKNPSFLWHITHTLDSGRAKILERYFTQEETPEAVSAYTSQVLDAVQFLKRS